MAPYWRQSTPATHTNRRGKIVSDPISTAQSGGQTPEGNPLPPSPCAAIPHQTSKAGASLGLLLSACVLTAMVSVGTAHWLGSNVAMGHRPLVFVDTTKLIGLRALELSSKQLSPEEAGKAGRDFAAQLKTIIEELQASGAIVIHGAALLTETDESDLTAEVAARLGVDLKAKLAIPDTVK